MLKESTLDAVDELVHRYTKLSPIARKLREAVTMLCESYYAGGKLLICGNGGSAADAEHIVGELMKGFLLPRSLPEDVVEKFENVCPEDAAYLAENLQGALPAISFVNQTALNTAFANDQAPELSFAQNVLGLGNAGDVLLGISTSGNSRNVIYAMQVAKAMEIHTIALTGKTGGKLAELADITIRVPETATYRIQEFHLPIYHMFCIAAEREFFGK